MKKLESENEIKNSISSTFRTAKVKIQREHRITASLRSDLIPPFLSYLKDYLGFTHLSHYSCVDWIEENKFELVFLLWNYEKKTLLIAKTKIDREKPEFVTISHIWPQAETYEREINEMFGVYFEGNARLGEFILEDWENIPPMRKDFDTVEFARDNFSSRTGREDARDVRREIAEKSGEEIPEFANKFSKRLKK